MATTLNGLPADLKQSKFTVPGTKRNITASTDFGPILIALASEYHRTVRPIDVGAVDDAGQCKREARAAKGRLSNHYNGTAIDLNWSEEGAQNSNWGKRFFASAKAKAAILVLKKRYGSVVQWGGDWDARDFMHWEIKPGVSLKQAQSLMVKLGINADGVRKGLN